MTLGGGCSGYSAVLFKLGSLKILYLLIEISL